MINVQNMRRWIAALRSRKYKRIEEDLYGKDNLSCALGVAGRELLGGDRNNYKGYWYIRQELGVDQDLQEKVIEMNDLKGKKFYEIARFLERKFKHELAG